LDYIIINIIRCRALLCYYC